MRFLKVILDMVKIQTNEHSLTVIATEFLSKHSIIENFLKGQKAQKREDGKSGGDIFILACSFHLKAYSLLDFQLEEIKKVSGIGSEGRRGSFRGSDGNAGQSGRR